MARRTTRILSYSLLLSAVCAALVSSATAAPGEPASTTAEPAKAEKISFKKAQLDAKFRSEGVAVGDYNRDGKLDIAAGSVYYAGPDWQMKLIQEKAAGIQPRERLQQQLLQLCRGCEPRRLD